MSSHLESPLSAVLELMSPFRATWFLCGGWAVDSWLGRQTRSHGDVDINIFGQDQQLLFQRMPAWNFIPHDARQPENKQFWDGWPLELPAHVHARPPGEQNRELVLRWVTPPYTHGTDGLDFEFVLNQREGDAWVLSRACGISLAVDCCYRESPAGLPAAVPEVLMFFKAAAYWGPNPAVEAIEGHPRPHDLADFAALVPLLGEPEAAWLRYALETVHPGHPWLDRLPG